MSKKQNELKNAIQSLNVSEALRLKRGRAAKDFSFAPPESSEIKSNSAPIEPNPNQAEIKASSDSVGSSSNQAPPSDVSNQNNLGSAQAEPTTISAQNDLGSNESPLKPISAYRDLRSSPSQKKLTSDRKDSDGFDLSPFLSEHATIELVERSDGSFHIPHRIYEYVHKAVDTKVELLVFNCLLRYTLGFQRSTCQASQSFISRWTGIAVPNVRKALKSLIERRFIRRLEEGTIVHDSAIYEIPIVAAYLAYDSGRKASELEKRSDRSNLGSGSSQISDQINPGSEIDSISKKEKENINKKKTLSRELPTGLQKYFSDALPIQKREREWKAFETLQSQFAVEQIELALSFVKINGSLEDKSPVHSPMAYLSFSIRNVLERAHKQDESEQRKCEDDAKKALELYTRQKQEAQEAEDFRRKEKAFCSAFSDPEHQEEIIRKICQRDQFGWMPKGRIARSIVIQTWWDELSVQERKSMEAI